MKFTRITPIGNVQFSVPDPPEKPEPSTPIIPPDIPSNPGIPQEVPPLPHIPPQEMPPKDLGKLAFRLNKKLFLDLYMIFGAYLQIALKILVSN